MQQIKVLLATNINDTQLDRLRSVSSRLNIISKPREQGTWSRSDPSDIFEGDEEIFYGFMPPRNLSKAPHLRWVQLHSAGIDHLINHPILNSDILLTTTSGIHGVPIGEFAIMMMLALARHVPRMSRFQYQVEWPPSGKGRTPILRSARPDAREGRGIKKYVIGIRPLDQRRQRLESAENASTDGARDGEHSR